MNEPILTIPQVALKLSVSTKTVRRLLDAGELRRVNVASTGTQARWRVTQRSLDNFLRRRRQS